MMIVFYTSGFLAIVATICVILNKNPIHALLYLISSLLFISCNLFSLRASFAGAIEIIVYAGAIMVLFIFAIMMLNMRNVNLFYGKKKSKFLSLKICIGVLLLMIGLLTILLYAIFAIEDCFINILDPMMSLKRIGITLFSSYILLVEIASFLLLSALISVLHIAQEYKISINRTSVKLQKYKQ